MCGQCKRRDSQRGAERSEYEKHSETRAESKFSLFCVTTHIKSSLIGSAFSIGEPIRELLICVVTQLLQINFFVRCTFCDLISINRTALLHTYTQNSTTFILFTSHIHTTIVALQLKDLDHVNTLTLPLKFRTHRVCNV